MALNIVCGMQTVNLFRTSKFFRQNLGIIATVEKNGKRMLNDKDKFSFFYNSRYRTTIYAQGNVGDIKFYGDHYIKDKTFAVYFGNNFEEFLFEFDNTIMSSKGIDFYLGHILKEVEEKYEEKVKNDELVKLETKPVGNPDMVLQNPGNVSYADLKAYMEKRNKQRYGKTE
jgi:hypothetical protein